MKLNDDKLSRDCKLLQAQFDFKEKKLYQTFRRELLKHFDKPDYAILMIINVASGEYIRYIRNINTRTNNDGNIVGASIPQACVKSILNSLDALKLTPASQEAADVSNTLSQLMNSIANKQMGGK